jgi:hypothetical protein
MSDTEIIERPSDRAKVESWRLHVLIEAGDLHHAVELVAKGCDPTTAAEILL